MVLWEKGINVKKILSALWFTVFLYGLVIVSTISTGVALLVGTGYWILHLVTNNRVEHAVTDKWPVRRDFHIKCTWTQHFYVVFMIIMGKFIGNFGG